MEILYTGQWGVRMSECDVITQLKSHCQCNNGDQTCIDTYSSTNGSGTRPDVVCLMEAICDVWPWTKSMMFMCALSCQRRRSYKTTPVHYCQFSWHLRNFYLPLHGADGLILKKPNLDHFLTLKTPRFSRKQKYKDFMGCLFDFKWPLKFSL